MSLTVLESSASILQNKLANAIRETRCDVAVGLQQASCKDLSNNTCRSENFFKLVFSKTLSIHELEIQLV